MGTRAYVKTGYHTEHGPLGTSGGDRTVQVLGRRLVWGMGVLEGHVEKEGVFARDPGSKGCNGVEVVLGVHDRPIRSVLAQRRRVFLEEVDAIQDPKVLGAVRGERAGKFGKESAERAGEFGVCVCVGVC